LNLLVLSNNYPPHAMGGYELLCAEHVGWLRQRGHDVTVVTSTFGLTPTDPPEVIGASGERVVRCLDFHWREYQHRRPNMVNVWAGERTQREALQEGLGETRAEAALAWGMGGISKSMLQVVDDAAIPVIAVVGEHWPIWDVDSDTWLRTWRLLRRLPGSSSLRGWANRTFAPTDVRRVMGHLVPLYVSDELRRAVETSHPAWAARGAVVPNGIRQDLFGRERPADASLHQPLRLLCAGRLERRKGAHTLVEALPAMVAAGLDPAISFVGWRDASYQRELAARADQLGVADRIDWRDSVPRERMADVYLEHDILVFPTIWSEPFGLVPLEAMAAGCVVVATATGGSVEFLRDGENALVFPAQDAAALAGRVIELAGDAALLRRLRQGGRQTSAQYSFERYAARLEEEVERVAAGRPPPDKLISC